MTDDRIGTNLSDEAQAAVRRSADARRIAQAKREALARLLRSLP